MNALLLAVLLTAANAAQADAIPHLDDCPAGARSTRFGHDAYCAPAPCSTDADCQARERCAEAALCVIREVATPGSGDTPTPPEPRPRDRATAVCTSPTSCGSAQCERRRFCVAAGAPAAAAPPAAAADDGCSVGGAPGAGAVLSLGLLAIAFALGRARSRR